MVGVNSKFIVFYFLAFSVFYVNAHIAEFDEYWKHKADQAQKNSLDAYDPHPELVTEQLNDDVGV